MRRLRILAMIILIPFGAGLAGCGGGEGGEVKSNITTTTVGQAAPFLASKGPPV